MRLRTTILPVSLVAMLLLAACGGGGSDGVSADDEPSSSTTVGAPSAAEVPAAGEAPAGEIDAPGGSGSFTAAKVGGGEFDSASLVGTDTVLWFWAPWCTTCRGEAPDVAAVAETYEGQVAFVGVAGRGEVPAMEDFVVETGTGGFGHVVDEDGSIWTTFEVLQQPAFAFIDDSGQVDVVGGKLGRDELTERVEQLLAS